MVPSDREQLDLTVSTRLSLPLPDDRSIVGYEKKIFF
jgi:hypothetical protein